MTAYSWDVHVEVLFKLMYVKGLARQIGSPGPAPTK